MDNTRRFEVGIELIPKTPLASDSMGELEVNSVDGGLYYHNGTSRVLIATTSGPQTLTGTTIDGDLNTLLDIGLTSLKTVVGDANKILKRDASGVVVSSDATLDVSNNLKVPGTIYAGSSTIDASAILQVDSTVKGAIFPRMTTAQRNAIVSPANGLWIFNTDTRIFEYYDIVSTSWAAVGAGSGGVVLTAQESIGTGNGVLTSFGPMTNVPNSEESVLVTIDGIVEDEANWSLSGSNIVFSTAPAAAQTIYVYYMYGAGPGGGGEANTASNMGTGADGEGLATAKVGVDLPFKRIKAGTAITVTSQTNDILISSTAANTASNVGAGSGVFKQKTSLDLEFKTLVAGSGITLTNNTNDITIASTSSTGPTIQRFTSGSGTYTTPANVKYLRISMVGAGGGGSGSSDNNFNAGNGSNGTSTTFGTSLLTSGFGAGGTHPIAGGAVAGAGGVNTINSPAITVLDVIGGAGGGNLYRTGGNVSGSGGAGGVSALGANGPGRVGNGGNAQVNTGSGGGGGGQTAGSGDFSPGSGGGAGAYLEVIISAPSATYSYVVGVSGGGGSAGTAGSSGGIGGSGLIVVEEYY